MASSRRRDSLRYAMASSRGRDGREGNAITRTQIRCSLYTSPKAAARASITRQR